MEALSIMCWVIGKKITGFPQQLRGSRMGQQQDADVS